MIFDNKNTNQDRDSQKSERTQIVYVNLNGLHGRFTFLFISRTGSNFRRNHVFLIESNNNSSEGLKNFHVLIAFEIFCVLSYY